MIIDCEQEGLLGLIWPPLMDGRVMLKEFTQACTFPTAASFRAWFWLADEVGEVGFDKGGNGLAMTNEGKASGQFIRNKLEVGRFL